MSIQMEAIVRNKTEVHEYDRAHFPEGKDWRVGWVNWDPEDGSPIPRYFRTRAEAVKFQEDFNG